MRKVQVLFVAADPLSAPPGGTPRRLLDEDLRRIREKVRAAEHRDVLDFDLRLAARPDDLLQALNEKPPQVVHFSGHGGSEGLVLARDDGGAHSVDAATLRQLFELFRGGIRVVVLSACFSEPQARAIADVVGCAIGTREGISEQAAITFNAAFYRAIAFGRSVQHAHEQACLALALEDVEAREWPQLMVRPDVDPAQLVLIPPEGEDEGREADGARIDSVVGIARRAREQDLRPRILERVPRAFVQADYLPLIRRLRSVEHRALAIVGDAGFGKTTMLGEIYDRLVEDDVPWAGVLLCADLSPAERATAGDLARQMGQAVSGAEIPLPAVCARLNAARGGGGVLLVDTLDLLLGGTLDRGVDRVLAEVVETGTTVVLTCREYEFAQFASPDPARAGPRLRFALRDAPPFSRDEVRTAAETYVALHGQGDAQAGAGFAERLLNLSAGNQRLEQIVRNPLLLALLCELFATEGFAVPQDLTVSRLYEAYWDLRVSRSRKHPGTPVPLRKAALCREIAGLLLEASHDHVKVRLRRDDLPVSATEQDRDALDELLSDGVLRVGGAGSVEFFHQTFLEYAMARWLNLAAHRARRLDLLRGTRTARAAPLHVWPIVRQVLTTADPDEFEVLVAQLDLADPMAFKVVALSAVAAEQPEFVERLVGFARERGPGFRDALLFAVGSAPRAMVPVAWRAVLGLMEGESFGVAMQVSKPLSGLLGQGGQPLAPALEEAISAFRRIDAEEAGEQGLSVALGTLMKHFEAPLSGRADAESLSVLRRYFHLLGTEAQEMVIRLHVRRGNPPARGALVRQLQGAELPPGIVEPLAELVRATAADRTGDSDDALAPLRRLEEPLPKGWHLLQARLAAWDAVHDAARLRSLTQALLTGDPRLIEKVHLALRIAIESGAAAQVAELLTREPVSSVPANRRHAVSRLVAESSASLGREERTRVCDWLLGVDPVPGELLSALASVADEDRARDVVRAGVSALRAPRRYQVVARMLEGVPVDFGRALMDAATRAPVQRGDESEADSMWVAWYHRLAREGYDDAWSELVRRAVGQRRKPALQAAEAVAALATNRSIPLDRLLRMAESPFPGVRSAPLRAALGQLDAGYPVSEEVLDSIAAAYERETNTAVLPPYFSLVGRWAEVHRRVPLRPTETIGALPAVLGASESFDRGMARGVAHVLKVMAQSGDAQAQPRVQQWALDLFASLDARLMNASQASMSELLVQLTQADPAFLERLLERAPGLPPRSIRVLAKTIMRTLGASSPLLDRIATAPWCPPEVRQVILGFRGT